MKIHLQTPIGGLEIEESNGAIVRIGSLSRVSTLASQPLSPTLKRARKELQEYFKGGRVEFSVPMRLEGSVFQKKVWRQLQKIPYGKVRSYAEIAKSIGHPGAARAVGTACGKNPLLLMVPCHRVVAASGLGGFGLGLPTKKALLKLENSL